MAEFETNDECNESQKDSGENSAHGEDTFCGSEAFRALHTNGMNWNIKTVCFGIKLINLKVNKHQTMKTVGRLKVHTEKKLKKLRWKEIRA